MPAIRRRLESVDVFQPEDFEDMPKIVPDVYVIGDAVDLYEVIHHGTFTRMKRANLIHWWFYLDCLEVGLRVWTVDIDGNRTTIDLCNMYHSDVELSQQRRPQISHRL